MNLLIVSDDGAIKGGASKVAIDAARELARRGHQVTFFCGVGPADSSLAEAGVNVVCAGLERFQPNLSGLRSGYWNVRAAEAIRPHLAGIELVHAHTFRDCLTASVFEPVHSRGIPLVMTAHDYGLACPYGGFFDFAESRVCTRVALSSECARSNCNAGSKLKKLWFVARQARQCKVIPEALSDLIVLSNQSHDVLAPYLPKHVHVHRIDNPIPLEKQPARSTPLGAPLLFVGAFMPHKAPEAAATAAKRLGVPIRFIGSGPQEAAIRAASAEATILPWATPDDVRREMRGAVALIFPSIWHEAQPLTVLEAMANGLPVVASNVSAATELVERFGGWVYDAESMEAMDQAIKNALDPVQNSAMSQASYARYWDAPLTLERHADALEQLYAEVLAR